MDEGFPLALAKLGASVARRPWRALPAATELTANLFAAGARSAALALGRVGAGSPVIEPPPKDRRFADEAWTTNPWFYGAGQAYLAWSRFVRQVAEAEGDEKGRFAADTAINAFAPTNFLPTNPVALRKAYETRGASVEAGLRNFLDDLTTNSGRPRQVDPNAFAVGTDLAATPGQVVYRDDLMELIQYAPQTKTVHEAPLLMSPPWINKYYIMDLAPDRSFIEWAVRQGHTVFTVSYRNPDASMRHITLDDYLGALDQATRIVCEITAAQDVNVAGLCVGGTLAVALHAHQAKRGNDTIRSLTLLNTLVDFSEPGALGVFTDKAAIERLEARMAETGYLDEVEMATTFDFLRANDLIWNYVSSGWLMGEPAPAFDILAWNSDATRIAEATHSFYLRNFYLENRLARGQLTLAGERLDLDQLEADTYILAAADDHITPWKSSYKTTGLLPTKVRFVLSSSGHIAGVVNPPSNKRSYWTNDNLPEDADEWRAEATQHTGSWWGDWTAWIADRAGPQRPPPPIGSPTYPPIEDAPGTYVRRDS